MSSCILHSLWIGKRKKTKLTKQNLTRQEESWTKLAKNLQWSRMLHKTRTTKQVNVDAHEGGALSKTCKLTTMEQDIAWDQSYKTSQHKCTWKRIIEKSLQKTGDKIGCCVRLKLQNMLNTNVHKKECKEECVKTMWKGVKGGVEVHSWNGLWSSNYMI